MDDAGSQCFFVVNEGLSYHDVLIIGCQVQVLIAAVPELMLLPRLVVPRLVVPRLVACSIVINGRTSWMES